MALPLLRATCENRIFPRLADQWREQLASLEDAPDDYYGTMMDHAAQIAAENPPDPKYGIFVLVRGEEPISASYEGLVHINHMLPGTSAATLRMVWNLLAPKYEVDEVHPEQVAELTASYLFGGIRLCMSEMPARRLKMYLHNATDRRYAVGIAAAMRESRPDFAVAVKGNWLHIDCIPR